MEEHNNAHIQNVLAKKYSGCQIKAMMGAYVWLVDDRFHLPPTGRALITFEAKALNDIHVSVNQNTSKTEGRDGVTDRAPFYEIVIGGWMNSKTVIRKFGQQQAWVRKETNRKAIITTEQFDRYWIVLDNGLIVVGKGQPGTNEILQWQDKTDDRNNVVLKYVGLSSWSTPIEFRYISISQMLPTFSTIGSSAEQLFNSPTLSDITLDINGTPIYAHRCILYCASPRFAALCSSEKPPPITTKITLDSSTTTQVFISMLAFLYTRRIKLLSKDKQEKIKQLQSLHELALEWKVISLARHCIAMLKSKLPKEEQMQLIEAEKDGNMEEFSEPSWGPVNCKELVCKELLSDVTFVLLDNEDPKTGQTEVMRLSAHRAILASSSLPFCAMFTSGYRESLLATPEISLQDVPGYAFKMVLTHIYTGELVGLDEAGSDAALQILLLADRFGLLSLKDDCCDWLQAHLDVNSCCDVISVAEFLGCTDLREFCLHFIETNFEKIVETPGFLELDSTLLTELLLSDKLVISQEEEVYEAVMYWVEEGKSTNKDKLQQLLTFVRFHLMTKEYLTTVIQKSDEVEQNKELKIIVEDAISYVSSEAYRKRAPAKELQHMQIKEDIIVMEESNNFRKKARATCSLEGRTELLFSRVGDENGLFYYIGTDYGKSKHFVNPHLSGKVKVTGSSPPTRYTKPESLVGRVFSTTSYTTGRPAWWKVDIGENHSLVCNHYTLRQDGSDSFIRNWNMQGSIDNVEWTDLRIHEDEYDVCSPGQWAGWPIAVLKPFRFFRILMTGPPSNAYDRNKLSLCSLELYGHFA